MSILSKKLSLTIIALILAGLSLTASLVLGFQVIKLKQDLANQLFPTPTPSVIPSPMPSAITPPTSTPLNPKYLTDESYCEKDSDCTTRPSCCNPCYKDYVNIYHKDPIPKEQCKTRCKQDCPPPSKFGPPVCQENKCTSLKTPTSCQTDNDCVIPCPQDLRSCPQRKCINNRCVWPTPPGQATPKCTRDEICRYVADPLWYFDPETNSCIQIRALCGGDSFKTKEKCETTCL